MIRVEEREGQEEEGTTGETSRTVLRKLMRRLLVGCEPDEARAGRGRGESRKRKKVGQSTSGTEMEMGVAGIER